MIKTIFVSGFDSEVNPLSRGQRTSIRSSGAPDWPSAVKTNLNLLDYSINSTGSEDPIEGYLSTRDPIQRAKFRGHVSGQTLEDFYVDSDSLSGARGIQTIGGKAGIDVDGTNAVVTFSTPDSDTLGQFYTMFFVWYPRETNSGWRTFYRGNNDHQPMIQDGTLNLGFYSNRNGNSFHDTGYDLELKWQTMVVVGKGTPAQDGLGESLYYVDGVYVGSVPRTKSGSTWSTFGYASQYPGYFREMGIMGTALDSDEALEFHTMLKSVSLDKDQVTIGSGYEGTLKHIADNTNSGYDSDNTPPSHEIKRFSLRSSRQRDVPNYVVNSAGGETNRTRFNILSGISPLSDEASKEGFKTEITVRRQIPSDVSGGGGGGGGEAAGGNTQIWY